VNQRLAAHRNRRGGLDAPEGQGGQNARPASGRAAEAAARVAARYAKAPSYSELLAGEARAAVRAAAEAAEAALNAHAAAQAVLDGLENRPLPPHLWQPVEQESWEQRSEREARNEADAYRAADPEVYAAPAVSRWQDEPRVVEAAAAPVISETPRPWPGAQPRWEEGLTPPAPQDVWAEMRVHPAPYPQRHAEEPRIYPSRSSESARTSEPNLADSALHDSSVSAYAEEAELFDAHHHVIEPVQVSHANLIEFPRELVAARKARPRLAEGPLYNPEQEIQQLSIFDMEPEQAGEEAILAIEPPGWASIELEHPELPVWHEEHAMQVEAYAHAPEMLEAAYLATPAHPAYEVGSYTESHFEVNAHGEALAEPALRPMVRETQVRAAAVRADAPPEMLVATFSDRMLAGLVDGALVMMAFLAAAVVVIASTAHPPAGRMALFAAACGLLLFGVLYQFLFLSFTEEGTPGMRYARIALCTFEDENPSIGQMQMRIPALLLAALPAGLGLFWSLWDKDHVGWHDRWTRTYQRKY